MLTNRRSAVHPDALSEGEMKPHFDVIELAATEGRISSGLADRLRDTIEMFQVPWAGWFHVHTWPPVQVSFKAPGRCIQMVVAADGETCDVYETYDAGSEFIATKGLLWGKATNLFQARMANYRGEPGV